jgi:predicted 3-demethylubiquinone-9 3-methyltransferase (glyoxalase superfamily)
MPQTITPFLWFDDNAEEAMHFYMSVFKDSKILNVSRYGDAGPGATGKVMTASERRAAVSVYRSRLVFCQLSDTGGGGRALGEAL